MMQHEKRSLNKAKNRTAKMRKSTTIAIFDLDYTLTKRGTWGRFVWTTVKHKPHLWLPLLISTLSFQISYKRGKIARGAVKKNMMRWSMQKLSREKLEKIAQDFAENEVANGLRPGGIAALDYHRNAGHHLIIASAAVDIIVRPISQNLGIQDFVSTELAWDESGRLQEDFASPNCYGEAKLDRVKALLKEKEEQPERIYFYSDSRADLPVLDFADIAVVVDPNGKTRMMAEERQMPIQSWMDSKDGFIPLT
jgi:HAD superfamily hydrolase (TIGR01490 family)